MQEVFIGREKELADLNGMYAQRSFQRFVLYGRRRVGKTALINEFCKDKPTVFFSALNASDKENLEALSKAIYEKDHPGMDSAPVYQSFDAAFDEITHMAENSGFFILYAKHHTPLTFKKTEVLGGRADELKVFLEKQTGQTFRPFRG